MAGLLVVQKDGERNMADEKCIVDPQRDCLGLHKAIALEKQMSEYRTQARETHAEMFQRISALERSGSAQEARYQAIMDKLTELSVRLNEALATIAALKEKPAKRWESIADKAIWAVLAAVIAFVLGRMGL